MVGGSRYYENTIPDFREEDTPLLDPVSKKVQVQILDVSIDTVAQGSMNWYLMNEHRTHKNFLVHHNSYISKI